MAENYESYHVPQQSRRDKLRVVSHNPDFHQPLFPIYDPSLLSSSDLLAYTTRNNPNCPIKEEGANFMGFPSSSSSPSTTRHHQHQHNPYNLDPQSALPMNPTCSIQDITSSNTNPLFYSLQTLRDFDHPYGNSDQVGIFKPDQTLALSLSSHHTHQNQSNSSLELNLQRYSSAITAGGGYMVPASSVGGGGGGGGSTSNEVSRSSVPLGPFTGYATVLKGSRFLKPAQQLLEEFCDVGSRGISSQTMGVDASVMDPPIECFNATSGSDDPRSSDDGGEGRRKKSRLISLLDEVYRRYKQYYQQMQAVVASFECVAGLGNAAPYANFALKTMSKHFKSLKNAITDQLQFKNKAQGVLSHGNEEAVRFGNTDRGVYSPRRVQNSGFSDHQPVWRPQRGLPERAVTVLRAWLFEHFLHPYPTDTDKLMLAKQTGLSRSQVSNWFINARVRLWKPMVEEIHMLETKQGQKGGGSQQDEQTANRMISDHLSNNVASDNPSTSAQRAQEVPSKRTRSELPDLPMGRQHHPMNMSYKNNSLSTNPHIGAGANMGGSSSGVSLTLGLHQNNGMGLSDHFPMNAAPQRFGVGLQTTNEGYVMGAFEPQNRHFGRDGMGGQLLHDFVG